MAKFRTEHKGNRYTPIGPGLAVVLPFIGTIELMHGEPLADQIAQVVMELDLIDGQIQPTSVKVVGRDGNPVTGTLLRQVPVKGMAAQLMQSAIAKREVVGRTVKVSVGSQGPIHLDDAEKARLRQQGPVDESLQAVANFYQFGKVTGYPPVKFVVENMKMPRPTAVEWIRKAREKGLLDASDP